MQRNRRSSAYLQVVAFRSAKYIFQRCVSSLHSWLLYNGLVLNPTKTEAICFGTSPQLQSLSHLTSIEVVSTSVSLVDHVKLLGFTFDKHLIYDKQISNVCSPSYFHIHALRYIRPFLDSETSKTIIILCYCWFQIRLCKFHSYRHFFSQYPSSSSARSKLLCSSRYSLNY